MTQESISFTLQQVVDKRTSKQIKQALCRIPGVRSVVIGDHKDTVSVDFDNTGTTPQHMEKILSGMGLEAHIQ